MQVEVVEPSTLLRVNYKTVFELTKKHDVFRQNFSRVIAEAVNSTLMRERRKKLPRVISIFHQSPATRPLTRRLLSRLQELGQNPFVVHDQRDWLPIDGIPHYCILQNGRRASNMEIRQQLDTMPDKKPIVIDVDAATECAQSSEIVEISEKVFWCVTPGDWDKAVAQLTEIERVAPNWRAPRA